MFGVFGYKPVASQTFYEIRIKNTFTLPHIQADLDPNFFRSFCVTKLMSCGIQFTEA